MVKLLAISGYPVSKIFKEANIKTPVRRLKQQHLFIVILSNFFFFVNETLQNERRKIFKTKLCEL